VAEEVRPIALEAGRLYELVVELEHYSGPCSIALTWHSPQTPAQIIPSFFLFPGGTPILGSPFDVYV
jgi:hypothetical protein